MNWRGLLINRSNIDALKKNGEIWEFLRAKMEAVTTESRYGERKTKNNDTDNLKGKDAMVSCP